MAKTTTSTTYAAKCYLKDGEDNDVTYRYNGVNPSLEIGTVKTLTKTIAENGNIFSEATPVKAVKAEIITTETTTVSEEISDDE